MNCLNSQVNEETRIKEELFFSSRKFKTAKLLELLSNGNNKDDRRMFHELRVVPFSQAAPTTE